MQAWEGNDANKRELKITELENMAEYTKLHRQFLVAEQLSEKVESEEPL
jgi:hypothetical protein